jgi:hypothetical protein
MTTITYTETAVERRLDPFAAIAFVIAVFLPPVAVVLAWLSLRRIKRQSELTGRAWAFAAIGIAVAVAVLWAVVVVTNLAAYTTGGAPV